ncbi:DUF2383 domain-containing protein [Paramaledivibacter caminithermalis]|jgi:uncharacterized protein (TIGR02284 family)|uniref:DUF2383 domain-containing protein n=1 Tax=Paramaledivibacter caminithermalis (strain DSM 15212 / CIP 107654 / DViRD3) TaxID=1121301 RepID=A0A1M6QJK0_PARC5|nr:DUF2383 domain-containing protein [Paramaledivibacter caminithermalis]SHK20421.1 conserved hypothetical protein [Paramaledivibacter caminithermalis DSM 15212]
MSKKETVKALNKLLQGEHMAIEAFNIYINEVDDEYMKKTFQKIQNQHRDNMTVLSNYIQDLGYKPDEKLGLKGVMGDFMVNMELAGDTDSSYVINKAIKGENQGINMAEKVLRGKLDQTSRTLAGEILKKDRESLSKLEELRH